MHDTYHGTYFRFTHQQSQCNRLYHVVESPLGWSAIWTQWIHRDWDQLKTSNSEQYTNHHAIGCESLYSEDNWESKYFNRFWNSWNCSLYSRKWLLYWLHGYLVIEMCLLTVSKPKSAWWYYILWIWRQMGSWHWSWLRESTNYVNLTVSVSRIQNTAHTNHCSQPWDNCPLSNTWCKV